MNTLLNNITSKDLKETIFVIENRKKHLTCYVDLLFNNQYLLSRDETKIKIFKHREDAIKEAEKICK